MGLMASSPAAIPQSSSDILNSEEPSILPQSTGDSSPLDSPSLDADEGVVIINEGVLSQEDDEEEEEECGFCIFMKGGGCKEPFIAWEKCVEDADKLGEDVVNKCMEVTSLLKKCMEENSSYYEPLLRVEQEMADAASDVNSASEVNSASASDVNYASDVNLTSDVKPGKPEKHTEKEPTKEPAKEATA